MSKTGALVQTLQENDDSFDGQGWIDEIEALNKLDKANEAVLTPVITEKETP